MRALRAGPGLLLAAAAAFFLFGALSGFTGEISHVHGFRQAQTLVAIQRMLEGGPWLWYELPVMGEPARLPHEFPLLHWLTALAVKAGGLPLLVAARGVALLYWLGALFWFASLLRGLGAGGFAVRAALALALCSPIYLHWGRAAIGETQALFFALAYLECFRRALAGGGARWLALCLAAGAGVALVKSLTLFATLPLAFALLARARPPKAAAFAALGIAWPVAIAIAWTTAADQWKLLNPLAAEVLASRPLLLDMIGPFRLRLEAQTWRAIWENALGGLFGSGWIFLAVAAAALALRGRRELFLLAVFLAPFLVLTHIYSTHRYYPCAVGLWAITAAALLLERLAARSQALALVALAVVLGLQGARFLRVYYPLQTVPNAYARDFGEVLAGVVGEGELALVYGWGYSAELTYFSRRKTLMNPLGHPPGHPVLEKAIADTGRPSAALFCLKESGNIALAAEVARIYGLEPSPLRHRYADCAIYRKAGRDIPPGAFLF